jgi:hypothetical protein
LAVNEEDEEASERADEFRDEDTEDARAWPCLLAAQSLGLADGRSEGTAGAGSAISGTASGRARFVWQLGGEGVVDGIIDGVALPDSCVAVPGVLERAWSSPRPEL